MPLVQLKLKAEAVLILFKVLSIRADYEGRLKTEHDQKLALHKQVPQLQFSPYVSIMIPLSSQIHHSKSMS